MAKSWNRTETWVTLFVLGVGAVVMAIFGLNMYMSATATPLHPDPRNVPSTTHADPSSEWAEAVERGRQIMRAGLTGQNLPGLSVAVGVVGPALSERPVGRSAERAAGPVRHSAERAGGSDSKGEIVWAEGFGFADLETREPVTPNHRFRIGTASKVLTSAAVGLLLEKEQLKLDEEIQTYVPEFPKKDWPVTLRQLMAHTAGLSNDSGDEGPLFSQTCERPVDAFEHFAESDLRFAPGTQYRYSSYGWIVVSAAVEAAARKPFLTFMQEQVFDPLGMRDTRPDSATKQLADRVTPYFPRFSADPRFGPDPMRDLDLSCYAGASVFLSTPSDLVRFGMAINSGKLLQPATVQLLQTPQRLPSGEETGYGLGWDLETVTLLGEPTRVVGHDGEVLGGIAMSLITFRERGIVVAVMSNTSYADTPSLAVKVAEAFAPQARSPEGQ